MAADGESAPSEIRVSRSGLHFNVVAAAFFLIPVTGGALIAWASGVWCAALVGIVIGWLSALAPRIARQWERAVVLRLGRYIGLRGPGLFWIIPLIDNVVTWIDQRTITTNFAAEQTLT